MVTICSSAAADEGASIEIASKRETTNNPIRDFISILQRAFALAQHVTRRAHDTAQRIILN
jgi:hypothetical protein